ncbi:MAG: bifunctional folylpolyglutamate synthase/dihydrofolate synthase, partial [Armatimonadetes bacterium]|nr:bifunctional folylpolyglutamate synthase/dihydrofolate synthase [Armatimonadota bacterium]
MTYQETLRFLESRGNQGIKLGLDRMGKLMTFLGRPNMDYPTVLVGGTNGKGSTVRMLSQILSEGGYRVGSYYSPHLHTFRERFCVNDLPISEEEFADLGQAVRRLAGGTADPPSQFELLTTMAFLYFRRMGVQIGILEVGLGGRWDATNCADPLVSVVTNVELDHTTRLGSTLEEIAREKAGIVRTGRPLILGALKERPGQVIEDICAQLGAAVIGTLPAECMGQDVSGE